MIEKKGTSRKGHELYYETVKYTCVWCGFVFDRDMSYNIGVGGIPIKRDQQVQCPNCQNFLKNKRFMGE